MRDVFLVLAVSVAVSFAGCQGQSSRPETFPVRGKVVYRGVPVAGANVAFLAPGAPAPAFATTNDVGEFQLNTFKPDDGAVPGVHVVTVRKYEAAEAQVAPQDPTPADIERAMQRSGAALLESFKKGSTLPAKYASRKTSDLKVEIKPGVNDVVIELTD